MMNVRQPAKKDCETLTALVLRSKAHWGYDADFLAACTPELTVHPRHLASGITRVACINDAIVAYGRICGSVDEAELDALFVDPVYIGAGIGRRFLDHMIVLARAAGMRRLAIQSDPGARDFYIRMGAVQIGEAPSGSIQGRVLPLMELPLI